jgi:2-polyprenyl-3-methyl-5-hydroxy-6-metoxy-1,4-benzoquinol methylase
MGPAIGSENAVLVLNYPECLRDDFPRQLPVAAAAVADVLGTLKGRRFDSLERCSPGLKGFDWANYLRCSIARMVHAAASAERRGLSSGLVLDCGSYFGNYSLMFRRLGFDVHALDSYSAFGAAMAPSVESLRREAIEVLDFDDVGYDLARVPAGTYDLVFCGGVIEHLPHTPRLLLEALDRVLKPGGCLVMDTPNLVHLYNRQKFERGESVMPEIVSQFHTEVPFQGHHREYTVAETVWMLDQIGHTDISVELFNYSVYGHGELRGRDVDNYWAMVADPALREMIMTASRKPRAGTHARRWTEWSSVYEDPEQFWQRRLLASGRPFDAAANVELTLVHLQEEVNLRDGEIRQRDRLLGEQEARLHGEIQFRDDLLTELREELKRARGFPGYLTDRLRGVVRRLKRR